MADKRTGRTQPIRLASGFIPVSIQKSMFLDDLMFSLPAYYVQQWMGELKSQEILGGIARIQIQTAQKLEGGEESSTAGMTSE